MFTKAMSSAEPEIFLLQNGIYHCKTCVPKIDIKAGGQDQSIAGSPYYDTIAIKVLDERSIEETEKKSGKTVRIQKMTLPGGGSSATIEFADSTKSSDPITGKLILMRPPKAKRPPAGAHAVSGSWRVSKMRDFSDNALMFTFMVEGDGMTMTTPAGQSYTAKLDGTDAPYKGDPGTNTASVERLSEHTFMETDKRGTKPVKSTRIMIVPGSTKTINLIVNDMARGRSALYVADKK